MDWIRFLNDQHIPYVSRGPNTKRGEVSVRCPWCAEDDPSEHLGINLKFDNWGCLRNPAHRGHSAVYLTRALLGCSSTVARHTVQQYSRADPESLNEVLVALGAAAEPPKATVAPQWPREFRALRADQPSGIRFKQYLKKRGFENINKLAHDYQLAYSVTGRFKDRIIFPVYQKHQLVGWTGRAIRNPVNAPRYLTENEAIKETLYLEDDLLQGGHVLFITEGPIDALKIDYYGKHQKTRATCTFGTSVSLTQICTLRIASRKFWRTVLLFDPDAVDITYKLIEWLPHAVIGQLPEGVEDPGALSKQQVLTIILTYS